MEEEVIINPFIELRDLYEKADENKEKLKKYFHENNLILNKIDEIFGELTGINVGDVISVKYYDFRKYRMVVYGFTNYDTSSVDVYGWKVKRDGKVSETKGGIFRFNLLSDNENLKIFNETKELGTHIEAHIWHKIPNEENL